MAIFQKSVLNIYLKQLDNNAVELAFAKFKENYSAAKIQKIIGLKEEEYQDGFLRDIFVDVFGYVLNPDDNYNLAREFKNIADSKKADGAILKDGKAIAVIELKSTKTKDFAKVTDQAFGYKNNQPGCKYVIISNFQKLRFYIDFAAEYEEFDLFKLSKEEFDLLYLILNKDNLFSDLPLTLKEETKFHEEQISDKLYNDYSRFKKRLFDNLVKNNLEQDQLTLFKKSQKLLDRFLFILFSEDCGLLPPNSIPRIVDTFKKLEELDAYKPIYEIYKQYFGYMNIGRKGKTAADDIPAYNGGLFYPDELLDNLIIDDSILMDDLVHLSAYDFNTDVDVNILGHIFEHSLGEIEEITAQIEGTAAEKAKGRRKKDGVFYTPKYITQYIVENTIGKLCKEKRAELGIDEIEFDGTHKAANGKLSAKGKKLFIVLEDYKKWLISLKIIDPACGSGAFLNQALNFLIEEHRIIDDIIAELTGEAMRLFDTDKSILENNLYGVDINEESVEIAKLSLWLRTAQKGRKLSNLNSNIKCGNSLIDDPEIAGDKAFDWHKEFPQVFKTTKIKLTRQEIEEFEKSPNYLDLIEKNAKLAHEKAKQSAKLSQEAILYSKKVYELTQKQRSIVSEDGELYGINKGGFDVVIGNPPYVLCQPSNTPKNILDFYKTFKVASYKIDLFHLFFEKSIEILKSNGIIGFITPNTYLTNKYIKPLRSYILDNSSILNVVNHKEPVFAEAGVDVSTIILSNTKNQKHKIKIQETDINNHSYRFLYFKEQEDWEKEKDNIFNIKDTLILEFRKVVPLIDICSSYFGIQAYDRKSSMSNIKVDENYLPVIDGGDIFPYQYSKPKKFFNFIEGNIKSGGDYNIYKEERIVIRQIGLTPIVGLCKGGVVASNTLYNINLKDKDYDLKYVLSILNSNLIKKYWLSLYSDSKQLFPKIKGYQLKELPIKISNKKSQRPFIEKADKMLEFNRQLQEKKAKFLNRVKDNFEIEKVSKKLDAFYNFDFKTFVAELKKQKVKLSLVQQDEWEEYFMAYKTEINQIQAEIESTDKEIDRMVYGLYELTDEEIKIVEEGV